MPEILIFPVTLIISVMIYAGKTCHFASIFHCQNAKLFIHVRALEPHKYPLRINPTNVTMDEADSISVKLTELLRHPEVASPLCLYAYGSAWANHCFSLRTLTR